MLDFKTSAHLDEKPLPRRQAVRVRPLPKPNTSSGRHPSHQHQPWYEEGCKGHDHNWDEEGARRPIGSQSRGKGGWQIRTKDSNFSLEEMASVNAMLIAQNMGGSTRGMRNRPGVFQLSGCVGRSDIFPFVVVNTLKIEA